MTPFSHAAALARVRCPVLLLHGAWRRLPDFGLVGAMDDQDARRVQRLAPQTVYCKINANHVIHRYKPRRFLAALERFADFVRSESALSPDEVCLGCRLNRVHRLWGRAAR